MQPVDALQADPERLLSTVHDAHGGKAVLPELPSSFVWNRRSIETLLVPILEAYFISHETYMGL